MIKLKDLKYEVELNESVRDRGIFKAIFFAGIPGAGKSYVLSKITDGNIMPRIINTDTYTEFLISKLGRDISKEFEFFEKDIKKVTLSQLVNYINGALPLFVDGTSNSPSSLFKRDGILKSFGYDTGMVWINTDLNQALSRAKSRTRTVPEDFIIKVHESLAKNKSYYQSHFKTFVEINNNDGELTDEIILSAYNKVRGFYNNQIENPIGIENRDKMMKSNGYLVPAVYPDIGNIAKNVGGWYNK